MSSRFFNLLIEEFSRTRQNDFINDHSRKECTGNWKTISLIVPWLIYWIEHRERRFSTVLNWDIVCRRTLILLFVDEAVSILRRKQKKKTKTDETFSKSRKITYLKSMVVDRRMIGWFTRMIIGGTLLIVWRFIERNFCSHSRRETSIGYLLQRRWIEESIERETYFRTALFRGRKMKRIGRYKPIEWGCWWK